MGIAFDSSTLENYFRLASRYDSVSLVPKNVESIRVSNIKRLSGGITNNLFSFVLKFTEKGSERNFNLVLKTYPEPVALWFRSYRPNEDVRKYMREFQTLKSLENAGFPVPKVYLCECDPFFLGSPFVIMGKEEMMQESTDNLSSFAATLARLHNLKPDELGIKSLSFPDNESSFAAEWAIRFKHTLTETRHYRTLKKDFEYAIDWLESNAKHNICSRYCLLHGEYHPGHTIMTEGNVLKVIDWEGAAIGDPAYDVGYAYHMVKLMYNSRNPNSGGLAAEEFVSEYSKNFHGDIRSNLKFYQVVGILGVTIAVSSWISNPLEAYRRFGRKALARALAFPYLHSNIVGRKWLDADFVVSYLQYCHEFLNETLRE